MSLNFEKAVTLGPDLPEDKTRFGRQINWSSGKEGGGGKGGKWEGVGGGG